MTRRWTLLALIVLALSLTACAPREADETTSPFLVVGIDGGEWSVIHALWEEGKLPNLRALADRGVAVHLGTRYTASPVIWTTLATGRTPEDHGITDFVVATDQGDVPVSSTVRRVPALWNMVSAAESAEGAARDGGPRVAVLGWWASWPAEEVRGIVVGDRVDEAGAEGAGPEPDRRAWPPEILQVVDAELAAMREVDNPFTGNAATRTRDLLMTRLAERLARDPFDLMLVYYRGVDIVSHESWHAYRPEDFAAPPASEPGEGELIPKEYEAVDAALGRILAAYRSAGVEPNVVVVSDHGFHAARREIVKIGLDLDPVLEHFGYLARGAAGADLDASSFYVHATPPFDRRKKLRFGSAAPSGDTERAALVERLRADLSRLTWVDGTQAFAVVEPSPKQRARGAEVMVLVGEDGAGRDLKLDGALLPAAISARVVHDVRRISGTHGEHTDGIFLAAGPQIDPGAGEETGLEGIDIHDLTPTVLHGLGLPVAEDFAGVARVALFRGPPAERPVRTIPTWGAPGDGNVTASDADTEMVEELRALGYLD